MRVLVTGASGWIGSAAVPELLAGGHEVLGVARSEASGARITALGAEPVEGSLDDPAGLGALAARVDGVVHLAYHHDFSEMTEAAELDRAAIEAMGTALAPRGGLLVVASGTLGLRPSGVGLETDRPDPATHPRVANAQLTLDLAERGVRSAVVRFAPTVHGEGDQGFTATLARIAVERGESAYVDDGANRWPAVHRLDAGALVRLVAERAPAGSVAHAVAEEGVSARAIAEALGAALGVPTRSVPAAQAAEHFGWIGGFFAADIPASSAATRERYGWEPTQRTLLEDIAAGAYPGTTSHS